MSEEQMSFCIKLGNMTVFNFYKVFEVMIGYLLFGYLRYWS